MTDDDKAQFVDSLKAVYQARDSASQAGMTVYGAGPMAAPIFETLTVAASEVPDYPPPFVARATRVDPSGRIWLLERANLGSRSPLIYHVIDRSGQIVDRVQMPPDAAVIGFGPGASSTCRSRRRTTHLRRASRRPRRRHRVRAQGRPAR